MNATKAKYKSWDATIEALERLEAAGPGDVTQLKAQISALTAELAAKNAEIKILKTAAAGQQNAPAAAATTPAAKPIDAMSRAELATAADEAHMRGDAEAENRYFRAHAARRPTR